MEDDFKIYVDRVRGGNEESLDFAVPPHFVGVPQEFRERVQVTGVAYCTDSDLILRLNIETEVTLACAICTEPFPFKIDLRDCYHVVELAKISGSVFNFEDLVRDALLLHLPHSVECMGGKCPEREGLARYFSKREEKL